MDTPLKAFEDLFNTKAGYRESVKELSDTGSTDIAFALKMTVRRDSIPLRFKKMKLTHSSQMQSDWTYNETPPMVYTDPKGSVYVMLQYNGPGGPSRLVFCSTKAKAAKILMGAGAVVILRKPKTKKERVEATLRRLP